MLEVWYESSRRRPLYRHQIVEIPPIVPQVAEHRFHQLVCPDCGCGTRALIPEIVEHGYGVNVVARTVKQSVSSFPSPSSASHARLVWSGDVVGSVNQLRQASAATLRQSVNTSSTNRRGDG